MENRLVKIMTVLTVAGLMAAGPVAYAESQQEGPMGGPGMEQPGPGDENPGVGAGFHHRGPKEFMKELNLTPEQREKLKAQREAKKENNKAMHEQLKAKMQALHEAVSKPGTTRADVENLVNEVNAIKGQMFSQRIDGLFAMKEILTPEQFAKMQAQHQSWMNKRHEGRGKKDAGPKQE